MQYGIAYEDIYNFDEIGNAMGLISTTKVVTRSEMYGQCQVMQPGNWEWVTSIECGMGSSTMHYLQRISPY